MKKLIIFFVTCLLLLVTIGGTCAWKSGEMFKGILVGDTIRFEDGYKYFSKGTPPAHQEKYL